MYDSDQNIKKRKMAFAYYPELPQVRWIFTYKSLSLFILRGVFKKEVSLSSISATKEQSSTKLRTDLFWDILLFSR